MNVDWSDFILDLSARFKDERSDAVEQLNSCKKLEPQNSILMNIASAEPQITYALISKPLTCLLKAEFVRTEEATLAFDHLKLALTSAQVLALPDFSKPFEVAIDASDGGIVLCQCKKVIHQPSQASPKWKRLSVYEKELLAMVTVVQKWEQYLSGNKFIIRSDQTSLKWLLQPKISIPFQQIWFSKLMGFDNEIFYKCGKENLVVDALSRVTAEVLLMTLSFGL